jgi:hypothetical protein
MRGGVSPFEPVAGDRRSFAHVSQHTKSFTQTDDKPDAESGAYAVAVADTDA